MTTRIRLVVIGALLALLPLHLGGCDGKDEAAPDPADAANVPDAFVAPDAATGPICAGLGGTCVPGRWAQCPPSTEPADDVHADCMPASASRGYFCCVPAVASSCSSTTSWADCFKDACHTCWGEATDPALTCEPGRTCCSYTCLD